MDTACNSLKTKMFGSRTDLLKNLCLRCRKNPLKKKKFKICVTGMETKTSIESIGDCCILSYSDSIVFYVLEEVTM